MFATYIVENDHLVGPTTVMAADGMENTVPRQFWNQLFKEQHQQYPADGCEIEVVNLEESVELVRRAVLHELAATEDDDVVRHKHNRALCQRRHGRLARYEAEILWSVSFDHSKGLLKDGPKRDAKWPVQGGKANLEPRLLLYRRHCDVLICYGWLEASLKFVCGSFGATDAGTFSFGKTLGRSARKTRE
jgi:hypothetical protein